MRGTHVETRRSARRPWVEVTCVGEGPSVLVVPAAQGDRRWFQPTFEPLATRYRLLFASLRGERHDGSPPGSSFGDLVDDVAEILDVAGVERASLVGCSFGGSVALAFALDRPSRVESLVLGTTCAKLRDHARFSRLVRTVIPHSRFLAGWFVHVYAGWRTLPEVFALGPGAAWSALRRALPLAMLHGTPAAVLARRLEMFASVDMEARLHEIACPTLVLTGEPGLDGLVSPHSQRSLCERIDGVEHRVLRRTGHFGVVTAPEATLAVVSEFLDRAVTRPPA